MGLKRKRSMDGLQSSPSSSRGSDASSPAPYYFGQSSLNDCMDFECASPLGRMIFDLPGGSARHIEPLHLNSRTRKRFRDNRPEEHIIYDYTYQKLYQASQRVNVPSSTAPLPRPVSLPSASSKPMQSTLHSFWNLPEIHRSLAQEPQANASERGQQCEDCDAWLNLSGDVTMDDGMDDFIDYRCCRCARIVCDTCSIPGDDGKECLQCKTSVRHSIDNSCWITHA